METTDIQKTEERFGTGRHFTKRNSKRNRIFTGLFFITAGGLFLMREAGFPFPSWFFSWPVLLMGIGLFSGVKHGFRNAGWLFPFAIGAIFLADRISDDVNLRPYFWPIVLIAVGFFIMLRPRNPKPFNSDNPGNEEDNTSADFPSEDVATNHSSETLDVVAVFGGVKKNVLSKDFRGGEIVAVMGGAEINLTQADFKQHIKIECVNVFGGTKLIIPPDWELQSDMTAIFGGIDDKRQPATNPGGPSKIVYLEGISIFGGLEIKSF